MKEFIFGIEEENSDYAEVFFGWIRNHSPELIRCKDCKWWNADTCMEWFGTPYAPADGYCFRAERKKEDE